MSFRGPTTGMGVVRTFTVNAGIGPRKVMESAMFDRVEGYLEVGHANGEVIINHPDLKPDENGVGHIVFSPRQARALANLLMKHADQAWQESGRPKNK